jgi:hypothetical protein
MYFKLYLESNYTRGFDVSNNTFYHIDLKIMYREINNII